MCGINGILRLRPDAPAIDRDELVRTRDAMTSRGPDGEGAWYSPDGALGLGFRRLAILDLSPAADQPMVSADGRYALVFNGEIYNFRELRRELLAAGATLRSSGDSEVVFELLRRDGVDALGRLRGMFALAFWDAVRRRLLLARDPFGIKPLYYSPDDDGSVRFASQVRALLAGGHVSAEIDANGLAGFLLWGSVPEPSTIRRAVRAVPAGCCLVLEGGRIGDPLPYPTMTAAQVGAATPAEAIEESVQAHLVADVPLAIFLSAGIDSGLIAALARRRSTEPPTTITVRFDKLLGTAADEGPLAAEVARRLGTHHIERTLGATDLADLWSGATRAMDQPSIDGINTWLVSRAAREAGFSVVLSGLGGDELFGSYPSFREVPRWQRGARALAALPGVSRTWPGVARRVAPATPKLAALIRHGGSLGGAYFLRRGLFLPEELPTLLGRDLAARAAQDPAAQSNHLVSDISDPWLAVQRLEQHRYLRNQLLRDADWASMAHSVELRVPFVDIVLQARLAHLNFEPARGHGKAALAREVAPELPAAVTGRTKTGFAVPLADWLGVDRRTAHPAREIALRILADQGIELATSSTRYPSRMPVPA